MRKSRLLVLIPVLLLLQGCPGKKTSEPALRYRFQTGRAYRYRFEGRIDINSGFPFGRFLYRIRGAFRINNSSGKTDMLQLQLNAESLSLYRRGRLQRLPGFIRHAVFRRAPVLLTSPGGQVYLFKRVGDADFKKPDKLTKLLLGLILPAVDTAPAPFPGFSIPWRGERIAILPEGTVREESGPGTIIRKRTLVMNSVRLKPVLFHNLFLNARTVFNRSSGLPGGCTISGSGSGTMQAVLSLSFTIVLRLNIYPVLQQPTP